MTRKGRLVAATLSNSFPMHLAFSTPLKTSKNLTVSDDFRG